MRLPEAKIKVAILHPEKMVRQKALLYFADTYSLDAEVMPLAIQAFEQYGRRNAFLYFYILENLAQTEATVEWAIRELHREEDRAEDRDSYFPTLSRLLCRADPQLVIPRADEIFQAPGFYKELVPDFEDRRRLAAWDADQCWKELERICAESVSKPKSSSVDFGHASRIVAALARQEEPSTDRLLNLLDQQVVDFETDPMSWLEIFLVMLAGEMRLEPAIPLIVKKLHEMGEILSEECVDALGKIGTDAAAEAVAEGWLETEWDYRIYATSALEKIHSDTTVRKCLELLPQDKDLDIRTKLANALLGQIAEEGIEPVRAMVEKQVFAPFGFDLRSRLVAVSTILGVTFPEYPIWKREAEEKLARMEQRMKAIQSYPQAPPQSALPPKAAPVKERDRIPDSKPAPFLRTEKQVGRNDPCPCGSGKKFKKCCMNRNQG